MFKIHIFRLVLIALFIQAAEISVVQADAVSDNPIMFVTVVPNPRDFGTLAATFSNHIANPDTAFRGGDLWIRYGDGSLKNLTQAAGYGNSGLQSAQAIAVRDPHIHWDGNKAIFSMVVGAATQQYQVNTYRWQLYEITGFGQSETPVITKVANQPEGFNNFSAVYASDDTLIFATDRPRDESVMHTYPQRDEYESAPTNTGLWKLNPASGELKLLDHAPSGDFNPIIDSFGRIIFTRWDHLQRDQQNVGASLGAYNFASEASTQSTGAAPEFFPEARSIKDPDYVSTVNLHTINQFFPWMMNQDGTDLETLNHVGRQEIGLYSERSFNDDPNVQEFYGQYTTGKNTNEFTIFLHIKESPTEPGKYYGTSCQEFATHAAGQVITLNGAPSVNPNDMQVGFITHPDTSGASANPGPNHSGLYRDPLPLSNGKLIASHTSETREDANTGTTEAPGSRYSFRLKLLNSNGTYHVPAGELTAGITKSVSFWSPDQLISYNGPLWEMMPVEVKSRARPAAKSLEVPETEKAVIAQSAHDLESLKTYLKANNLALIVSRNLTSRDKNDRQQPTNLRVTGTSTESVPNSGKVYDISDFQIFQGDLIRGYQSSSSQGRRVIAQPLHAIAEGINIKNSTGPAGSVEIASDGSMAAIVPAGKALSWQMTAPDGTAVVRERYWLTFQPGEIRVCTSCHGVNTVDHLGKGAPENSPLALSRLLANLKNLPLPQPTSTPGNNGQYSLKVKGLPEIKSGKKFKVTLQGAETGSTYTLSAKLNTTECSGTAVFTGSGESRELKGKFPKNLSGKVIFSAGMQSGSSGLATKNVKLKKQSKNKKKAALPEALCTALLGSLK